MTITVLCPHFGHHNIVQDRIHKSTQRETGRRYNKNFGFQFRYGELYDITR